MRLLKRPHLLKLGWFIVGGAILIGGILLVGAPNRKQVSETGAAAACQDFYDKVTSNIKAQSDYTILNSKKDCTPGSDEAGSTDYYFEAHFRLSKAGNETREGITANSKYLVDHYPRTDYPIWARNDAAVNGRPDTICFDAAMQIQENGEAYNSYPADHYYYDYTEPGSLPNYAPCSGL